MTDGGIYFVNMPSGQHRSLEFFDFKTSQYRTIVAIEKGMTPGIGVSPDGRWVYYSLFDRNDSDIMMAQNFR